MSEIGKRPSIIYLSKKYFKNNPLIGVELGVFKGINAERLLKNFNIHHLYLVDLWITPETAIYKYDYEKHYQIVCDKFKNNNKITIIRNDTVYASKLIDDNSIDFVYIDADHSYDGCKRDINAWFPKVKSGGIIFGHDYHCCNGVNKAVNEFAHSNHYKVYEFNAIGINDKVKYGEWCIKK